MLEPPQADDCRVERVQGQSYRAALALLLTGRARPADPAVDQFLLFASQQRMNIQELWAAVRSDQPIASFLIVPSPGRTAMVFLSPVSSRRQISSFREMVAIACQRQEPARLRLLQGLLEPGQRQESDVLRSAGFRDLASLVYMERPLESSPHPTALPQGVQLVHWHPDHRDLFADCILRSYEQTQDCPALLGLRNIDDVLAGHMGTGSFDPALWFALHCSGEPVGVMLLNAIPQRQALELVYLGLAPRWRGRGLATTLLRHAIGLGTPSRASVLILAVDQANVPAMKLYRKHRFTRTDCKNALIFVLGDRGPTGE
jgi:GNAT superfamily N-acetyltransferase